MLLVQAGPADLDVLLPLLARFNASQGYVFDAARTSTALAALRALMEEARALGVRALHLEVEAGNAAGQALYRGEGFCGSERRLLSRRVS